MDSHWIVNNVAKLAIYYRRDGLSTGFCSIASRRDPTVHFLCTIQGKAGANGGKQGEIGSLPGPNFSNAGNHMTTGAKIVPPGRSNS